MKKDIRFVYVCDDCSDPRDLSRNVLNGTVPDEWEKMRLQGLWVSRLVHMIT